VDNRGPTITRRTKWLQEYPARTPLTIALGVGSTTAIFSGVYGVLLRPLPYPDPSRLVEVFEDNRPANLPRFRVSTLNYLSWTERATGFEALGVFSSLSATLTDRGDPESVPGANNRSRHGVQRVYISARCICQRYSQIETPRRHSVPCRDDRGGVVGWRTRQGRVTLHPREPGRGRPLTYDVEIYNVVRYA
jgi:hypothetical protein